MYECVSVNLSVTVSVNASEIVSLSVFRNGGREREGFFFSRRRCGVFKQIS